MIRSIIWRGFDSQNGVFIFVSISDSAGGIGTMMRTRLFHWHHDAGDGAVAGQEGSVEKTVTS